MPVPMSSASGLRSGTAWACMMSHQRAVGVVVFEEGDQRRRHRPDLGRGDIHELHHLLEGDQADVALADPAEDLRALQARFSSTSAFAWAITFSSSWVASRWTISSVTTPSLTTRYGVVTKPCSETSA